MYVAGQQLELHQKTFNANTQSVKMFSNMEVTQ